MSTQGTPAQRVTVGSLRDQLAGFDPNLEVWVADAGALSGFTPAAAALAGFDLDPGEGEPGEFVVITTDPTA